MKKEQLEIWLVSKGFTRDTFGHYRKEINGNIYRFKLSNIAARYEKQIHVVDHNEWIRIASGYYKDLSITSENKLAGIK